MYDNPSADIGVIFSMLESPKSQTVCRAAKTPRKTHLVIDHLVYGKAKKVHSRPKATKIAPSAVN
jgi:hypothetical protein